MDFICLRLRGAGVCVATNNNDNNYGLLKDLLSTKQATWTKLDFQGASVEDERCTIQTTTSLPKRTTLWKKDQVLNSESAPVISDNVRGLWEERKQAKKNEVIDSVNDNDDATLSRDKDEEDDDEFNWSEERRKPYSNLKDVLLNNDANSSEDEELKP